MTTTEILSLLRDARRQGGGWQAKCPAHKDDIASLSVSTGDDGRTLLKCHAGCTAAAICRALGIKMADLFVQKSKKAKGEARIIATYDYKRNGELIFQAVRMEPKDFRLRRPDGRGGWIWKMNGTPLSLYHYDEIVNAPEGETIFVVEGEKDADRLRGLGVFATTNALGAGKWRDYYSSTLQGNRVAILVDNDDTGRNHGRQVANSVWGIAAEVKIIELPGLPPKGDVSDWLDSGGDKSKLLEIVNATKPLTAEDIAQMRPRPIQATQEEATRSPLEAAKAGSPIMCTDLGNAKRFAWDHSDRVRHCQRLNAWFVWSGTHWQRDETGMVHRLAFKTVEKIWDECRVCGDTDRQRQLSKHAIDSQSRGKIEAMLALATKMPGIAVSPDAWDRDPMILNCLNGTIDLQTGKLRVHDARDMITKICPVKYNPDARLDVWDRFLDVATEGNTELSTFLQRATGYSITGLTSEEKLFFVHGGTATGKSTFLQAILATLGSYGMTSNFDTFLAKHHGDSVPVDLANMAGARIVVASETNKGRALDEGRIKSLTGGEAIRARKLYCDEFEYKPQFAIWLAANDAPHMSDADAALWRRIVRVPFENTIPESERDPNVKRTLSDPDQAGPAILAWAVQGCLAWQREGLQVPAIVTAATQELRTEMDPLQEFLDDRCVFIAEASTPVSALRAEYDQWARESGLKWLLSPKDFNRRIAEKGCLRKTTWWNGKDCKCWHGIGLQSA